jgi:uncharacterized protein
MESFLLMELAEIPEGASVREGDLLPARLEAQVPDVELAGPVHIHLDLFRAGDSIRVQGDFHGRLAFVCVRCLAPGQADLMGRLEIYCEKREGELSPEDRLALEEGGVVFHDGKVLDLFDEIRQSILLEIPWYPVCRPDCRGLCPRCGADLNAGPCGCGGPPGDPRWSALRQWLR